MAGHGDFCPQSRLEGLDPYSPGLSVDEIRGKYGLSNVVKLASNENPLGVSPLVRDAIERHCGDVFRYPRGGNPRLARAIARMHGVDSGRVAIGNGSDEVIDLLVRIMAEPGAHNIVCFQPCFSIYPLQARIAGIECRRQKLADGYVPDFSGMAARFDSNTRLVFITAPDNPTGHLPDLDDVRALAERLAAVSPGALLVVDEAYMDFAPDERAASFLVSGSIPDNVAVLRTFSKSYGLAGLRIGYGILPPAVADIFWRARLPFSVNVLAEEAALAALEDDAFRELTLRAVAEGRGLLSRGLEELGCRVWPSAANFMMFRLPEGRGALECHEWLLGHGIIIRPLKSYGMPDNLRVSVGSRAENEAFLECLGEYLA